MNAKFFNRMEFAIPMRKIWEPGSPAIKLQSGEIIEGPYEILSSYKFLAPVPFDFHKVESVTQGQTFEYKDNFKHEPTIITEPLDIRHVNEPMQPMPTVEHTAPRSEIVVNPISIDVSLLPFDPKTVNWLTVKIEELQKACELLNIDIKSLEGVPNKELKWELVRLVKKALGVVRN